jgi:hypothetical protein
MKNTVFPNLNLHSVHVMPLGVLQTGRMEDHWQSVPNQIAEIGMHPMVMGPPGGQRAVDYLAVGCTFTQTPVQGLTHLP